MTRRILVRIICILAFAALAIWILFFGFPTASASNIDAAYVAKFPAIRHADWKLDGQPPSHHSTTTTTIVKHVIRKAGPVRGSAGPAIRTNQDFHYLGPCIVAWESAGGVIGHKGYEAHNLHSTASGEGQWLDTTWNNWGGYSRALLAPPSVQDARLDYDLGLPLSHIQSEWAAQRGHCNF